MDFAAPQIIREYLLGTLPIEQQAALEERLLLDDELYEELSIVESELVDDYLDGNLSVAERESFRTRFAAAPEHRERIRFGAAFRRYVAEHPPTPLKLTPRPRRFLGFLPIQSPALGYAFAAVLVLAVVGVSWLAWKSWLSPTQRDPGSVLAVTLTPGLSRGEGEGGNQAVISPATNTVRLQLLLPENRYPSYEATLIDSDGRTITTARDLKAQVIDGHPAVVFDVSTSRTPRGDYRVKVNGVNQDGSKVSLAGYSLRVRAG